MRHLVSLSLLLSTAIALPLNAQATPAVTRSTPSAQPIVDTILAARDIPYPGTMTLSIDASDTTQRIWREADDPCLLRPAGAALSGMAPRQARPRAALLIGWRD